MHVQTLDNGTIEVKYTTTHSHSILPQDIHHHPIPSTEKDTIKTKLSVGIPAETIYRDLREGHGSRDNRDKDFHIKKKHFISKRQIKEMARKLKVNLYI